jgi:hypothetical protein
MPLQNRVTPTGDILPLAGRGTIMGNRGVLHNANAQVIRPWQVRRWIACVLEFRGRHRAVMQANRWTELFFLDEATAFSAGHRPCAECRNADYKRFRALWERVHGTVEGVDVIDNVLHVSRLQSGIKRTYGARIDDLPDGTFVMIDGAPWLIWHERVYQWSDRGYVEDRKPPRDDVVEVLTPEPIVAIFAAGYVPAVHPSVA